MVDTPNDPNTPVLGEDVVLRERERLKDLLESLPSKAQLGFSGLKDKWNNRGDKGLKEMVTAAAKTNDPLVVEYTCLDVTPAIIVFGSNLGIVYLYDRKSGKLSRFVCEVKHLSLVWYFHRKTERFLVLQVPLCVSFSKRYSKLSLNNCI